MNHEKRTRQLGTRPVGSLLLQLSIPAVSASVVGASYGIINRIFVGRVFDADGIAAVTVVFPIFSIMLAAGMMISFGSGSLISIRLGEKKYEEAEKIVGQALLLYVLMSIGFFIFGMVFQDPMLQLFRTPEKVMPLAKEYLTVLVCGAFFHEMSFGVNTFLRCEGKARTAMVTVLISAFLNILFDYLFLIVFRTGIWGAALATILAQFFSTGWVAWHYIAGKTLLRWRWKDIRWNTNLAYQVFLLGLPPFILQVLNCVLQTIQMYQLGHYGKLYGKSHGFADGDVIALDVLGVVFVISMLVFFPVLGLNQGFQPIIGYNIGARQFDRVAKALKLSLITAVLFMAGSTLVMLLFPEWILSPFINADSPLAEETMKLGKRAMRIFFSLLPAAAVVVVASGYFQANGMPNKAIAVTLVRQVLFLIPLLLFLPHFLQDVPGFNGLDGLWYAVPLSDIGGFLYASYLLYHEYRQLKSGKYVVNKNIETAAYDES